MKPKKPYTRMNAEELAEATKGLGALSFEDTEPLSEENRQWWDRAKRRPGRANGAGDAHPVLITVRRDLLDRADRLAEAEGISRSELMARGLEAVLRGRPGAMKKTTPRR